MSEVPVIIEVAVNGQTLPERNPHVPRTPDAIRADSVACLSPIPSIAAIPRAVAPCQGSRSDRVAAWP